jgi:hypothetical protein
VAETQRLARARIFLAYLYAENILKTGNKSTNMRAHGPGRSEAKLQPNGRRIGSVLRTLRGSASPTRLRGLLKLLLAMVHRIETAEIGNRGYSRQTNSVA